MEQMGKRFAEVFKEQGITKVVTIEASGIAPALFAARELDVPMIFARKAKVWRWMKNYWQLLFILYETSDKYDFYFS